MDTEGRSRFLVKLLFIATLFSLLQCIDFSAQGCYLDNEDKASYLFPEEEEDEPCFFSDDARIIASAKNRNPETYRFYSHSVILLSNRFCGDAQIVEGSLVKRTWLCIYRL